MLVLPKMYPHTAAKHDLLKAYLDRWFPILGLSFGGHPGRINYIDGFAGPGEYATGEIGSPQIAINCALAHVASKTLGSNVEINFIFVEAKPSHVEHLRRRLEEITVPSHFKVNVIPGQFADVVGAILDGIQQRGTALAPTFAFVDPFGFKGIPFELMGRILKNSKSEVYINIMVEFINRFLEHPDSDVVSHFPRTFGTNKVLDVPTQTGNRTMMLLDLYRSQLLSAAKFVGRFDMHGTKDQHTYSLYFASNHLKGFEKMKEANWKVDKANGGKFSDRNPAAASQVGLFGHFPLKVEIESRFRGKKLVPVEDVELFVAASTDYLRSHLRGILVEMEQDGELTVDCVADHKRKGKTFPNGKVLLSFQ